MIIVPCPASEAGHQHAKNTSHLALLDSARERVRRFPAAAGLGPQEAAKVCTDTEIAAITGVLFMFQRFILDVTIDMVRCKEALDGRDAAATSPFPVV